MSSSYEIVTVEAAAISEKSFINYSGTLRLLIAVS